MRPQPIAAIAVEKSHNSKIGLASASHATQGSCDDACVFKNGGGCYANSGTQLFTTLRLNKAEIKTPEQIAEIEAVAIGKLTGRLPLRVHVVGDCATDGAARTVSAAMASHTAKADQPAWTYTHSWRTVQRDSWTVPTVIASCESTEQVRQAWSRGYSAAIVVDHLESDTAYSVDGVKLIPCPNETRGLQCVDCRLCLNQSVTSRIGRAVIAFPAHSAKADAVKAKLAAINA